MRACGPIIDDRASRSGADLIPRTPCKSSAVGPLVGAQGAPKLYKMVPNELILLARPLSTQGIAVLLVQLDSVISHNVTIRVYLRVSPRTMQLLIGVDPRTVHTSYPLRDLRVGLARTITLQNLMPTNVTGGCSLPVESSRP